MIATLMCAFNPMMIVYILIAFLVLMIMVTIHELGHYTAGKLLGFKINEFAIGMGPKIFSKKMKSGELFSIRIFPLGGFCAFDGEDQEGENAMSFNKQKPWKRLITLFMGAFFNFVSAIIIAFIVFACFGDYLPTVSKVFDNSPNSETQIFQKGDVIYSVDGKSVLLYQDIFGYIKQAPDIMKVEVIRNGKRITLENVKKGEYKAFEDKLDADGNVVLDKDGNPVKVETKAFGWGVGLQATERTQFTVWEALGRSFPYCGHAGVFILKTFGDLVTGQLPLSDIGGPITTIKVIADVSATGFANILFVIILISVNLAVFNLLPIPALDGSRMVFVLIEWIRGKPVNRKVEGIIHFVGLILIFAFVIIIDLLKLF
ncbi:MAG: site-2 protease family protein [Clostridia bacterium]